MPLVASPGETTRPITDRAKQSLFDALQDCFAVDSGGIVLDFNSEGMFRGVRTSYGRREVAIYR